MEYGVILKKKSKKKFVIRKYRKCGDIVKMKKVIIILLQIHLGYISYHCLNIGMRQHLESESIYSSVFIRTGKKQPYDMERRTSVT